LRWGDVLTARGAGTNTQIVVDMTYSGATSATNGFQAVLSPSNAFMTNFTVRWFTSSNLMTTIGRSLEFEVGNNATWEKGPDKSVVKTTFDPTVSLGGTKISSANAMVISNFPVGLMGVGLDLAHNLAAGVFSTGTGADMLNLYDLSNSNNPVQLSQSPFPTTPRIANANFISQTFFKNGLLFTIDANNGIMVFKVNLPAAPSSLFLYEPFDYANVGGPVSSNTPANWTYGGSNGGNDLSVASGSLAYPGLATSVGNSVTNGGPGFGVRRLFGTNVSTGKIYFSGLFRMNDLGYGFWSGQPSIVGGLTATNNTSFEAQVVVKSNSPSGYIIGTARSGTGTSNVFDATERHIGETIFLVGKYDFTANSNAASLWINPSVSTFGAATEPNTGFIMSTNGTDNLTIDRFNMRQNAATGSSSLPASMQWDELRFGLTWADVTPPGPPPPVTLIGLAKLPNGAFQFAYTNSSSITFTVFGSTNLLNWQSIGVATQISAGVYQFTDGAATNLSRRYYQLRSP